MFEVTSVALFTYPAVSVLLACSLVVLRIGSEVLSFETVLLAEESVDVLVLVLVVSVVFTEGTGSEGVTVLSTVGVLSLV